MLYKFLWKYGCRCQFLLPYRTNNFTLRWTLRRIFHIIFYRNMWCFRSGFEEELKCFVLLSLSQKLRSIVRALLVSRGFLFPSEVNFVCCGSRINVCRQIRIDHRRVWWELLRWSCFSRASILEKVFLPDRTRLLNKRLLINIKVTIWQEYCVSISWPGGDLIRHRVSVGAHRLVHFAQ